MAGPANTPRARVTVEYDVTRGQRVSKIFDDAYAARRFYAAKLRAGRRPVVKKG